MFLRILDRLEEILIASLIAAATLLILPLMVPVLILGAAAVDAALAGLEARPHLMILAALSMAAAVLCPYAAAAALRQALE